jgi:hypothetical protein
VAAGGLTGGRSSTSKYVSSDQERDGAMPASAAKAWIRAWFGFGFGQGQG